jgi:hypothetical protein
MKYLLSLLCFLFLSDLLCDRVSAQPADDSSTLVNTKLKASVSALKRTTILLHTSPGNAVYPGQFNHFEVIDERVDTARIGVRARTGLFSHNHDRQLVFVRPAATEIAGYLDVHFGRQEAPFTALLVLRTLWLSDANYTKEDLHQDPEKKSDKFQIRLKAEIYAGKDSLFTPIFRYDTLLTGKAPDYTFLQSSLEADLSNLFDDLADSASLVAGRKTANGRKVTREQIREFNQSRFSLPMDSVKVYAAGVYATFEEFRNNAPSIHDFEIKTEGKETLLYIKDATGTSSYSHDAWGYSDGTSLYIMKNGILWPTWKEGRAIYFYGPAYKISPNPAADPYYPGTPGFTSPGGAMFRGTPGYYVPPSSTIEKEVKCIYTVDMDTGELY